METWDEGFMDGSIFSARLLYRDKYYIFWFLCPCCHHYQDTHNSSGQKQWSSSIVFHAGERRPVRGKTQPRSRTHKSGGINKVPPCQTFAFLEQWLGLD